MVKFDGAGPRPDELSGLIVDVRTKVTVDMGHEGLFNGFLTESENVTVYR